MGSGEGHASLALLDSLMALLVDKGVLAEGERDALVATTMDRLQGEGGGASLAALAALQAAFVADSG